MRGAGLRAQRSGERDLALAHTTALFGRVKKLEMLSHYLPRPRDQGGTMLDKLKSIAARTEGLS